MRETLNWKGSNGRLCRAILCGVGAIACVTCAPRTGKGASSGPQSQTPAPPHVDVQLLSERTAIWTGHTLWVGIQFQLPSGWHVYWQNPGDSGEPPKVNWNLPTGLHAGDLQWPAPERLESPSIVDYGYPNGVLLLAPIRVDSAVPAASAVPLRAEVRYLVCREICVPGKANVSLDLPARSSAAGWNAAAHALFEKTRAQLPEAAPAAWRVRAQSQGNYFVVSITTGKSEQQGVFFPLDPGQIENAAPQSARPIPRGIEFRLRKSDLLLKPISRLRGVVVLGGRQAYEVSAAVAENGAAGSGH